MTEKDLREGLVVCFFFFPLPSLLWLFPAAARKKRLSRRRGDTRSLRRDDVPGRCPARRCRFPRAESSHPRPRVPPAARSAGLTGTAARGHPRREGPRGALPPAPQPPQEGRRRRLPDRHPHRALVLGGRHGAAGRRGAAASLAGSGGRRRAEEGPAGEEVGALPRLPPHLLLLLRHLLSPAILGA